MTRGELRSPGAIIRLSGAISEHLHQLYLSYPEVVFASRHGRELTGEPGLVRM
jgi:hypothetical protein